MLINTLSRVNKSLNNQKFMVRYGWIQKSSINEYAFNNKGLW